MSTYLLTLLHFNLQYCAGGVEGLLVDWPSDEVSIEDQIVRESFAPVLDLLDDHPTWTFDIELQAYMVEVLAARHPDVLDHLRALADAGQVELVSFHYSDQLWIAYPPRDQEVSLDHTAAVFAANDLPLSSVVFTQEGQFALGAVERGAEWGYTTFVLPHNLAEYGWGVDSTRLAYRHGDAIVLSGGAWESTEAWTAGWHFLNDGELYATGDMNCYLGSSFTYDEAATAAKEAELVEAEAGGAVISGIGAFAASLSPADLPELPDTLDGTWQPDDTENVFRWMGGAGLWADTEQDNLVRTTVMAARHQVSAAERVPGVDADLLDEAWDEVLLAEVSDATGWNPFVTEVQYAFEHAARATDLAAQAVEGVCDGAGWLLVDGGVVTPDGTTSVSAEPADPPFELSFGEVTPTVSWASLGAGVTRLTVDWVAAEGGRMVVFPWDAASVDTIPAMLTEVVSYAPPARDPFNIALPLGVLRLEKDLWLVENTATVHLGPLLSTSVSAVAFRDETDPLTPQRWEFLLVEGEVARATEVALATNNTPPTTLPCPSIAVDPERACGCGGGKVSGFLPFLVLLRRGRRRPGTTP